MKKLLFAVLLFSACSPAHRLSRLLHKNPGLIDTFTQVVLDTTWTIRVVHDTTFQQVKEIDTLIAENDTIQTIIYKYKDVIKVRTTVKPYAIVQRDTVTKYILKPEVKVKTQWWAYLLPWWLPAGMALLLIYHYLKNRI